MNSTNRILALSLLGITSAAAVGCSDKGGGSGGGDNSYPETIAPLCSGMSKEVFTTAVVPGASVLESLIFGGMDPGTLEPINFELGFRLIGLNVPVTAPTDLYVHSMARTSYTEGWRAGETDYSIDFQVCSVEGIPGERHVAVEGDFAHMTTLAPDLVAILDAQDLECFTNEGPGETVETCRAFFPASETDGLMIAEGTPLGSAGGTGLTEYAPGFDFNLFDTRYPNNFLNPDRLGSEEGPGRGFRYGACTYDYFAEPARGVYMGKVGQNGDFRVHDDFPCGTLSIDSEGTAAGIWIREDMADLEIESDWVGVLENVLVLGPHPVFPGAREVISSELLEIANWAEGGLLMEFEQTNVGSINRSFYEMVADGTTHCVMATGFSHPAEIHYFVEVLEGGAKLKVERLIESCEQSAEVERLFTDAAITFVR